MLEHIVSNLRFDTIDDKDIFLCTSDSRLDDRIASIGANIGIKVIRGSEYEPIQRYWENLKTWEGYMYISRVNGDSPMYVGRLGLTALKDIESKHMSPDVITSTRGGRRRFPSGLSLEIYRRRHLNQLLSEHEEYCQREHMSDLIRLSESEGGSILEVGPLYPIEERYNTKLTVDTFDDYHAICKMFQNSQFSGTLKYYREIPLYIEAAE